MAEISGDISDTKLSHLRDTSAYVFENISQTIKVVQTDKVEDDNIFSRLDSIDGNKLAQSLVD